MNEYIKQVCRIGQGAACCKYLVCGRDGFECMKWSEGSKALIDQTWLQHVHTAQGDNCPGQEYLKRAEMPAGSGKLKI